MVCWVLMFRKSGRDTPYSSQLDDRLNGKRKRGICACPSREPGPQNDCNRLLAARSAQLFKLSSLKIALSLLHFALGSAPQFPRNTSFIYLHIIYIVYLSLSLLSSKSMLICNLLFEVGQKKTWSVDEIRSWI